MVWSVAMPVELENTQEGLFELVIGKSVAKRIDGTVEVAQPVRDVVEHVTDARVAAEADD